MSAEENDTPGDPRRPSSEATPSGRYIPYSGGSAGWFENTGVMKSEQRNNYRYHQEMDLPEVRARQFLRWGTGEERRESGRKRRQFPLNLVLGDRTVAMTSWDLNERGLRLQYTEDLNLTLNGDVTVELLDKQDGKPRVIVDAQVIWVEIGQSTRSVWNAGLFFPYVSAEDTAVLRRFLG